MPRSPPHHTPPARLPWRVALGGPKAAFLGEYDERDNRHGGDIHDAEWEQDDEQKPAAAKAKSTVEQAHAQRADGATKTVNRMSPPGSEHGSAEPPSRVGTPRLVAFALD